MANVERRLAVLDRLLILVPVAVAVHWLIPKAHSLVFGSPAGHRSAGGPNRTWWPSAVARVVTVELQDGRR